MNMDAVMLWKRSSLADYKTQAFHVPNFPLVVLCLVIVLPLTLASLIVGAVEVLSLVVVAATAVTWLLLVISMIRTRVYNIGPHLYGYNPWLEAAESFIAMRKVRPLADEALFDMLSDSRRTVCNAKRGAEWMIIAKKISRLEAGSSTIDKYNMYLDSYAELELE